MELFVEIILGMPTGIYTVLLGCMAVYWFFTILGVVDIDLLDIDGAIEGVEGSVDGVLEGADGLLDAADGALEGVDGALEGVDGALEGADGLDPEIVTGTGSVLLAVLNFFHLRAVPLTISLSILILFSWAMCYLGSRFVLGLIPIPVVAETIVFCGAMVAGAFGASLVLRPFEGKFVTQQAKTIETYLGSSCTITSSRVDGQFGEAKIPNPNGAPLLMQVRCDHENALKKGSEALVVSRDIQRKVLIIEPMK